MFPAVKKEHDRGDDNVCHRPTSGKHRTDELHSSFDDFIGVERRALPLAMRQTQIGL